MGHTNMIENINMQSQDSGATAMLWKKLRS